MHVHVIVCVVATHLIFSDTGIFISKYGTTYQDVVHANW